MRDPRLRIMLSHCICCIKNQTSRCWSKDQQTIWCKVECNNSFCRFALWSMNTGSFHSHLHCIKRSGETNTTNYCFFILGDQESSDCTPTNSFLVLFSLCMPFNNFHRFACVFVNYHMLMHVLTAATGTRTSFNLKQKRKIKKEKGKRKKRKEKHQKTQQLRPRDQI